MIKLQILIKDGDAFLPAMEVNMDEFIHILNSGSIRDQNIAGISFNAGEERIKGYFIRKPDLPMKLDWISAKAPNTDWMRWANIKNNSGSAFWNGEQS